MKFKTDRVSRSGNQAVEMHYFEQFRSHFDVPAGEIEYTDKPDVIIRGNRVMGVEVARLFRESGDDVASEQKQRNRRQRVLSRAQALHRTAGGQPIEITVDFEPSQAILNVEAVAGQLADLALRIEEWPSGSVDSEFFRHIPQVRYVYKNAEPYRDPQWRPAQSYRGAKLDIERVREMVWQKDRKALEYQACDAYWLLLVVEFMDRAQDQELSWPEGVVLDRSLFERIFLYKPPFAQVVELPQSL